jgi:ATP/maltotriose-dependent transcriptional regulator MalT
MEGSPAERDVLLATKLQVPRSRPGLVPRRRQRHDLRNFLLETSVLERLSGSLCNAVTGRDDSQELLEEVDRSGLFVVQLGRDSRAFRLIEQLTSRELEVLAMLAAGRSNQGIASHLVISLDTVKKHVSHLMGKLAAANRTEAVARGRELGLID